QQGLDPLPEIGFVRSIDLGCDLEPETGPSGNFDGTIRALFGSNAAEEREVVTLWIRLEAVQIFWQAVIDGSNEIRERYRAALVVRDRDERKLSETSEKGLHILDVLTTVERRDRPMRHIAEKRHVQTVSVEVQHVEPVCLLAHFLKHCEVRR